MPALSSRATAAHTDGPSNHVGPEGKVVADNDCSELWKLYNISGMSGRWGNKTTISPVQRERDATGTGE